MACEIKCGGYVIWKSRLGGWMSWAFDIKTESEDSAYLGSFQGSYFESTSDIDGDPYVAVDYTNTRVAHNKNLKDLSLANDELDAVRGIIGSMAVYFVKENGDLELMRINSADVPKSSLANGGHFTLSLSGISTLTLNVR